MQATRLFRSKKAARISALPFFMTATIAPERAL